MSEKILWLRSETKAFEKRCALTPADAKLFRDKDIKVCVESSSERIFKDEEYKKAGCEIVPEHSWKEAPEEATILGLKELPEDEFPLKHNHVYFAHCYKKQAGSEQILERFEKGNGLLYDLEYLTDENKRRVAAFGYWAGFIGAGLAVAIHAEKEDFRVDPTYYDRVDDFIKTLKNKMQNPNALVIGAKGRSGQGALDLFNRLGISCTAWDREETSKGGPFSEVLEHDILVNCVFLNSAVPSFVTRENLKANKQLSVISDVSCDPTGPYNPLPIYGSVTTFENPTHKIESSTGPVFVQAIDHLPSLLPRESSEEFSKALTPHLLAHLQGGSEVFNRAKQCFTAALKN